DASDEARGVSRWLDEHLNAAEPIGVSDLVLSAMVRIGTSHRAYQRPVTPNEALVFADALRASPGTVLVQPGPRHWRLFTDLVRQHDLRAKHVPDAFLAAMALEVSATFVTRDRGFDRFPGLRMLDPLA
ncbi:MAG: TA system VapC family ribonuclease toxin, partial [Nocardioides sp.]